MGVHRDTIIETAGQAAASAASSPELTRATYWFSAASLAGSLSNVDPIAFVAVAVAVCTFVANQVWAWVKNRREARAAAIQLQIDELTLAELVERVRRQTSE